MATGSIYHLSQVDYSQRGQIVQIMVDGVHKSQTVIFSGTDCFGESYWLEKNKIPHRVEILRHFK